MKAFFCGLLDSMKRKRETETSIMSHLLHHVLPIDEMANIVDEYSIPFESRPGRFQVKVCKEKGKPKWIPTRLGWVSFSRHKIPQVQTTFNDFALTRCIHLCMQYHDHSGNSDCIVVVREEEINPQWFVETWDTHLKKLMARFPYPDHWDNLPLIAFPEVQRILRCEYLTGIGNTRLDRLTLIDFDGCQKHVIEWLTSQFMLCDVDIYPEAQFVFGFYYVQHPGNIIVDNQCCKIDRSCRDGDFAWLDVSSRELKKCSYVKHPWAQGRLYQLMETARWDDVSAPDCSFQLHGRMLELNVYVPFRESLFIERIQTNLHLILPTWFDTLAARIQVGTNREFMIHGYYTSFLFSPISSKAVVVV